MKPSLILSLCLSFCLYLRLFSRPAFLSPSLFHTHTSTHKPVPLIMKRTSWILSLSPVLFSSLVPPSPTVVFWTSNQEPLSLYDSPLLIPHSQRAFFNSQCTNSLVCHVCACVCVCVCLKDKKKARKRECKIAKERRKENKKGGVIK